MSESDEIIYAKPALWDASPTARLRHRILVTRLALRCAIKGHEWRTERPTRVVRVVCCRVCGHFVGSSVDRSDPEHSCLHFRPSMVRHPPKDAPEDQP